MIFDKIGFSPQQIGRDAKLLADQNAAMLADSSHRLFRTLTAREAPTAAATIPPIAGLDT
jgi:hypothetical protein